MKKIYAIIMLVLGFSYYSTAQVIDLVGTGIYNTSTASVAVGDPVNIYEMTLGVVYKSADASSGQIRFYDDDEDVNASWVQIPIYKSVIINPNIGTFTTTFTTADEDGINEDVLNPADEDGVQAFYGFLYRDLAAPSYYSEEIQDKVMFYHNGSTDPFIYNVPISTGHKKRNIKVKVPLVELDQTSRMAVVDITAGNVTYQDIITTYNQGESLYLGEYLLEKVGKNVTNVEISIYSPDPVIDQENGDSFIVPGVVVDVGTRKHCTYTQGFYGNYGGKVCGETNTDDFIYSLLYEDLVLGGGSNTLTLTQDDVDCLIARLPGGGPPKKLNGAATCSNPVGIRIKHGRFKNSLLAQTITLGLNLRFDDFLGDLRLKGRIFRTWRVKDCSDPLTGKKGRYRTYFLSQDVLDHLGADNTINDLYTLANAALAGDDIGDLCLGQITCAIATINKGFDECRILKRFYNCNKDSEFDDMDDDIFFDLKVYPNPMNSYGTIEFTTVEAGPTIVELYNIMGVRVESFINENAEEFTPYRIDMDSDKYPKGMYILYIRNGSNVYKEKISIVN